MRSTGGGSAFRAVTTLSEPRAMPPDEIPNVEVLGLLRDLLDPVLVPTETFPGETNSKVRSQRQDLEPA